MLFKRAKLQPVLAFHWLELLRWTCTSPPPPLPHLLRPRPTLLPCRCLRMSPRFIPTSQDRVFETPTNLRSSPNVIIPPLLKNICVRVFFSQLTFWTGAYYNLQWCFEEQRRRSVQCWRTVCRWVQTQSNKFVTPLIQLELCISFLKALTDWKTRYATSLE